MIGIYLITNKVNDKVYVGQSVNIERRFQEHLRSGQPDKYAIKSERDTKTPIHLAMQKYGVQNFTLSILEECKKEELNDKERYWIQYYHSNEKQYGYNISSGGQENFGLTGENHSQAKLTQSQVDDIIQLLKKGYNLVQINKKYPIVSKSTLSMINQGKIWFNENEKYPIQTLSTARKGQMNGRAKFTDELVMQLRTEYSQGTALKDLCKKYKHIASESAIKAIIYGQSYKHLPIWKNKTKQWIEPCIDYPLSLKQAGE